MNIVLNKIRINASIEKVFDFATTAKYWPQWHPACISVDGSTEKPYQLADEIHQVAYVAGRTRQGTWMVTEHERPHKVMLEMNGGRLQVRYTFIAFNQSTRVIRRLTYPTPIAEEGFSPAELEQIMHNESELGMRQLKLLIENESYDAAKNRLLKQRSA